MFTKNRFGTLVFSVLGYDGIPVESMQRLDLGGDETPYGGVNGGSQVVHGGDNVNFDPDLPSPPQDNNQVAAWYDTDL